MAKPLYIIGAGSVGGHLALNLEQYSTEYEIAGFYDDDPDKVGADLFGVPVLGQVSEVLKEQGCALSVGISFPKIKQQIINRLLAYSDWDFPTFIHQRAWISEDVEIGKGCIIYPGTMVNYGCKIGDHSVFNMNCSLGHHTKVGRYASFAPGVQTGGHTEIGEMVEMGIGSATLQGVKMGDKAVAGGLAMVTKSVA